MFAAHHGQNRSRGEPLRSASVMTLEPTQLAVVPKDQFAALVASEPDLAVQLIEHLIGRVRSLTERVTDLALMDVYGRVARLLLEMAEKDEDGQLAVLRKISKQDIAKMIGASREMVSRVMKDLQLQGLIVEGEGRILLREKLHLV